MSYGRFGCAFLGILLFANFFSIGRAGVFDWTLGIDGLFNDPARWTHVSGGGNTTPPPGAGDSANFDVPGAYEVTFKTVASPFTTSFLGVSDGNVTFASDGVSSATYIVTGGGSGGDASLLGGELTLDGLDLQVADRLSTQGNSTLNIQNGSHVIAHELFLGGFFGDGFVNVIGSPSSLSVTGSVTHSLGNNKNSLLHFSGGSMGNLAGTIALGTSNDVTKTATLTVDSGSKLDTGSIIAGGVGNTAVINVSGNNSSLTQGGVSTLMLGGATGSAMLNVNSGGTFATGTGAVTFGDSATIDISDGTLNAHGAITLAAGTMLTLNGGALNVNAGLDNSAGGNLSFLDGTLTLKVESLSQMQEAKF